MLGFVGMYVPINKAVQKESYTSFNTESQIILKEIRKDLCFPSTNILGFLLQINRMCLRPCCSLSLLPNCFSRNVFIWQVNQLSLYCGMVG